jgi:hypothetical protein
MSSSTEENLPKEALAAARREGARAERRRSWRRLLVALVVSAMLLAGALAAGWALMIQARDTAPEVISEMVMEQRAALEQRLSQRADEVAVLGGEFFGFLQQMWRENESLHRIRASVGDARAELSLLDDEVRAAMDAPLFHLEPLLENGPTRARQIVKHLVVVSAEIRRLVPTVFEAMGEARRTFKESPEHGTMLAAIASMDVLFEPFLGGNERLRARWGGLKDDLFAWVERVEEDLAVARRKMRGDTLGDEFLERMGRRLF